MYERTVFFIFLNVKTRLIYEIIGFVAQYAFSFKSLKTFEHFRSSETYCNMLLYTKFGKRECTYVYVGS